MTAGSGLVLTGSDSGLGLTGSGSCDRSTIFRVGFGVAFSESAFSTGCGFTTSGLTSDGIVLIFGANFGITSFRSGAWTTGCAEDCGSVASV